MIGARRARSNATTDPIVSAAFHESGHAVAVLALGEGSDLLSVERGDAGEGMTRFHLETGAIGRSMIRHAFVALCGPAAERLVHARRWSSVRRHAAHDYERAGWLFAVGVPVAFVESVVWAFVLRRRYAIGMVASELLVRCRLDGTEVKQIACRAEPDLVGSEDDVAARIYSPTRRAKSGGASRPLRRPGRATTRDRTGPL